MNPTDEDGLLCCSYNDCPEYDGKRCGKTGFPPETACGLAMRAEVERLRASLAGLDACRERVRAAEWSHHEDSRGVHHRADVARLRLGAYLDKGGRACEWAVYRVVPGRIVDEMFDGEAPDLATAKAAAIECAARLLWAMEVKA